MKLERHFHLDADRNQGLVKEDLVSRVTRQETKPKRTSTNLQSFHGSLTTLFAAGNHDDVTLFGCVGISDLLQFSVSFSVLLNRRLCRRCCCKNHSSNEKLPQTMEGLSSSLQLFTLGVLPFWELNLYIVIPGDLLDP